LTWRQYAEQVRKLLTGWSLPGAVSRFRSLRQLKPAPGDAGFVVPEPPGQDGLRVLQQGPSAIPPASTNWLITGSECTILFEHMTYPT
jgi:hypothetical protein